MPARSWITALSVVAAIAVNALAATLPLNGQSTGEISDRFRVYFVPAGYVFSIWGLIYLLWIAFTLYQLVPENARKPRFASLGYWFALSNVLNAAWLVCWHYNQFVLSLVVMVSLLVTLIVCYVRAEVWHVRAGAIERLCVDVMFGTYLGWITVATVANAADVLWFLGWDGWGISPQRWTVALLAISALIGLYMAWEHGDVPFQLVLVWAFVGIANKHLRPGGLPDAGLVIHGARVAAAAAGGLAIVAFVRRMHLARTLVRPA